MGSNDSNPDAPGQFDITNTESMAGMGICAGAMAKIHNMDLPEFLEKNGATIARAKLKTDMEVLEVFREMAISKKNWSATAMWVKMHCMHLFDAPPESKSQSPGNATAESTFRPIEFDVYCNDGEPNFDY
jgi:hypothetical protein